MDDVPFLIVDGGSITQWELAIILPLAPKKLRLIMNQALRP